MTIFDSKHMTRRVEWFRVGRQVYACPPYTLDELRRWVAKYAAGEGRAQHTA